MAERHRTGSFRFAVVLETLWNPSGCRSVRRCAGLQVATRPGERVQRGAVSGDAVDRYLGLIADVTTRKEADAHAVRDRDAMTGLRNRLGLVEELDKLLPDNPAFVEYMYDYAIVNQKGLQALGFDKEGASLPGIEIEKDSQGQPTGKLTGNIASFSALFARIAPEARVEKTQ